MRLRVEISILLAAALLIPASARAQKAVILVRHAEKVSDTDERLSDAGRSRAATLAALLKDAGVAAIYATETERARDTAAPLSRALAQPVRPYDKPADLLAALRKDHAGDVVLVVGHSNTVPEMLKLLGAAENIEIAAAEYDNLFVVAPKENGPATVVRLHY